MDLRKIQQQAFETAEQSGFHSIEPQEFYAYAAQVVQHVGRLIDAYHTRELDTCGEFYARLLSQMPVPLGELNDDQPPNFKRRSVLIVTEVAELLQAHQNGTQVSEHGFPAIAEELADIVIRVADHAATLGIDLERAVIAKMEYNKSRTFRHGDKR